MKNTYRTNNKNVEKLLKDIHRVLLRMEERLNIIETMIYVDDVAKKQILKGNE
jgi:hypothetical protein